MKNVVIKLTCNNFWGVNIEKTTKLNVSDVFLRGLLCGFMYFFIKVLLVLGGCCMYFMFFILFVKTNTYICYILVTTNCFDGQTAILNCLGVCSCY